MGDGLFSDPTRRSRSDFPFSRPGRTTLCLIVTFASDPLLPVIRTYSSVRTDWLDLVDWHYSVPLTNRVLFLRFDKRLSSTSSFQLLCIKF